MKTFESIDRSWVACIHTLKWNGQFAKCPQVCRLSQRTLRDPRIKGEMSSSLNSPKETRSRQILLTCYIVIKAGGIFLFPRIFPSYFMKILQKIIRKNVLCNISWNFSKSNSNFSELPHSVIYDERFRDLSRRLSADIVVPFLFQNPLRGISRKIGRLLWQCMKATFPHFFWDLLMFLAHALGTCFGAYTILRHLRMYIRACV